MKELNIKLCESTGHCLVTLDGEPVGLIQSIKAEVGIADKSPKVEIVFPDLRPTSKFAPNPDSHLQNDLADLIQKFKDVPFVTLKFQALEPILVTDPEKPVQEWASSDLPEDPKDLEKYNTIGQNE